MTRRYPKVEIGTERPYWWHICPFCGARDAVLIREEDRYCKACHAAWTESIALGRFIRVPEGRELLSSEVGGVSYVAVR